MKKILLVFLLAAASSHAQNVARRQTVNAAGRYQVTSLVGLNIYAHNLSWTTTGTVNACTIRLSQASSVPNWNDLGATYSCTSSGVGAVVSVATAINNVSVQVVTFSGSGSISFVYQGWMVSPTITSGATSPLTTKGDIWGYSTTNARIPVGANGLFLKADNTQPLGVTWAAAGAGTITGSGTVNTLPKFTAATAIGDTQINEAGGIVTVTNEDVNVTRVGGGATTIPALELLNSTAATLGTPVQAGPYYSSCGSAWDTDGLVADTHCWRVLTMPASATDTSSSLLFESFKSGGAYTSRFALPSSGFTAGSVPFFGANGLLSEDNANFFWDEGDPSLYIQGRLQNNGNTVFQKSNAGDDTAAVVITSLDNTENSSVYGIRAAATASRTSTTQFEVIGADIDGISSNGNTIGTVWGTLSESNVVAGSSATNAIGGEFRINISGGGTTTNAIAVNLPTVSGAVNNFALKAAGGWSVNGAGSRMQLGTVHFASLGTVVPGQTFYCDDCDPSTVSGVANQCTSAGAKTGAVVTGTNAKWACMSVN